MRPKANSCILRWDPAAIPDTLYPEAYSVGAQSAFTIAAKATVVGGTKQALLSLGTAAGIRLEVGLTALSEPYVEGDALVLLGDPVADGEHDIAWVFESDGNVTCIVDAVAVGRLSVAATAGFDRVVIGGRSSGGNAWAGSVEELYVYSLDDIFSVPGLLGSDAVVSSLIPTVTLTSPLAGSNFIRQTSLTIIASGACTDADLVELFASEDGGAYTSWGTDATVSGGAWEITKNIEVGDDVTVDLYAVATGPGGTSDPSASVTVTVRNWVPSDFGADIVVGYVATDVTLNGSYVTTFNDQGPNNKDLTQGTEAAQGTYQATCAVLNNKPAVAINDDWYSNADVEQADGNRTVFFVLAQDAKDISTTYFFASKTGVFYYYIDSTNGNGQQAYYDGAAKYCGNDTGVAGAVSHAALFDATGGTMELHNRTGKINTTDPQTYTPTNLDAAFGLFARHDGGAPSFNGDFAALYIIDHVASASELALWFGWSARIYGELG